MPLQDINSNIVNSKKQDVENEKRYVILVFKCTLSYFLLTLYFSSPTEQVAKVHPSSQPRKGRGTSSSSSTSSDTNRNSDSLSSATSNIDEPGTSWKMPATFPLDEKFGDKVREFQLSNQESTEIPFPNNCKIHQTRNFAKQFKPVTKYSIEAVPFGRDKKRKGDKQNAYVKLTKVRTGQQECSGILQSR